MKQLFFALTFFTIPTSAMFLQARISSCAHPLISRTTSLRAAHAPVLSAACRNSQIKRFYTKMTESQHETIATDLAIPCRHEGLQHMLSFYEKDTEDLERMLKTSMQETSKRKTAWEELSNFTCAKRKAYLQLEQALKNERLLRTLLGEMKRISAETISPTSLDL